MPIPTESIERCGVSLPKLTRELCLEENGEGCFQALVRLLLISSETS